MTRRIWRWVWFGLLLVLGAAALRAATAPAAAPVLLIRIEGGIGPATADHVRRGLQRAADEQAQLVVLQMDTPGGLDASMRAIIKGILASPVPVAAYVAPDGARAASAGTYILYASHLAAMAPASNLGAATPVSIGIGGAERQPLAPSAPSAASAPAPAPQDAMSAKHIGDAAAYIRSLAQLRGRNADWAERAVREAVSLSSQEALQQHVIELIARDVPDLLKQADGRELHHGSTTWKLATAQAPVQVFEAGWRSRLLSVITDPSLALMLMLLGVYGLLFEFSNPGYVLPGVVGAISLVLALFALQQLPVNYAGVALILLGIAFLVGEAFMPSGVLGVGGVAAFAFGALLLIDSDQPGFGIPRWVIAASTLVSAAFVLGVAGMAAKARRRRVVSGPLTLLGQAAELVEFADGQGWAKIEGELWKARGAAGLQAGQRVRVRRLDGMTLEVSALDDESRSTTGA